jgi:hypothetical protein
VSWATLSNVGSHAIDGICASRSSDSSELGPSGHNHTVAVPSSWGSLHSIDTPALGAATKLGRPAISR